MVFALPLMPIFILNCGMKNTAPNHKLSNFRATKPQTIIFFNSIYNII